MQLRDSSLILMKIQYFSTIVSCKDIHFYKYDACVKIVYVPWRPSGPSKSGFFTIIYDSVSKLIPEFAGGNALVFFEYAPEILVTVITDQNRDVLDQDCFVL